MRTRGVPLTVAVALCLALGSLPAHAASAVALGPGSTLWLTGKSTLHDYESRANALTLTLVPDPGSRAPTDAASLESLIRSSHVHGIDVLVPVRSLHSPKKAIDKNLWSALNADKHPNIRFRLSRYSLGSTSGDTLGIHAEGRLEISGQEQPEKLEVQLCRTDKGVWLEGSKALRMSEFGIRPPRMMMGTLRVADEIVVHYRLLLVPGGEANALQVQPK